MTRKRVNKEQILEAGMSLMYLQGYNATGIQDIANAAGVPKGSFYNYFKSKEDFVSELLTRYTDDTVEFLKTQLRTGTESPIHRLRVMLEHWAENMFGPQYNGCGCLMGNMTQELSNQNERIQAVTEREFARLEEQFVACFTEAKVNGELKDDVDVNELGTFVYNGWQGTLIRCKAEGTGEQLKRYVRYVFDTIIPTMSQARLDA